MIVISRDLARRFRAVAKKCIAGRPRGPAPPVVCRRAGGALTLTARLGEVAVSVSVSVPGTGAGDEVLVIPIAVLETVEGPGEEPVELERTGGLTGVARWSHRGVPRSLPFDLLRPGRPHDPLPPPTDGASVPAAFLRALHECGRTAAREGDEPAHHTTLEPVTHNEEDHHVRDPDQRPAPAATVGPDRPP